MKVLAIETSTMLGGVAIADDQGLIAEIRLNVKSTHSERIMTAIDHVLKQSNLTVDEIDTIAVASGPGSFTGLRIGLSTAKGLCYAATKSLVLVPTLEAFAWNFPFSRHPVCLMLDARKGEVYAALYRWGQGGFVSVIRERSARPEELLSTIEGPVVLAGEGALIYKDRIIAAIGERALIAPRDKMVPSPSNIAILGLQRAMRGEFADSVHAGPLYIRKSEAEVKWSEKH
jgi:tRNA threonylcarbamoyladenosine biosynthesis protein TsaB